MSSLPEVRKQAPKVERAPEGSAGCRPRRAALVWAVAAVTIAYAPVWTVWIRSAVGSPFNSYVLLVPAISGLLAWRQHRRIAAAWGAPNRAGSAAIAAAALGLAAADAWLRYADAISSEAVIGLGLASMILALAATLGGLAGRGALREASFPLLYLLCSIPLPADWIRSLESILQHLSASAAAGVFQCSDLPVLRLNDIFFRLPGITLAVEPECSGIQSTVALLLVSLAASHLFLRSPWRRALLCLAVIPLGILRNALRIVTIGELCVRIGPHMIDSYLHRHGGWIFFLLSLAPLLALIRVLMRSEGPAVQNPVCPHL